jgi:hypothetical protein
MFCSNHVGHNRCPANIGKQKSQGQILALAFRLKSLKSLEVFPLCSEAVRAHTLPRAGPLHAQVMRLGLAVEP